jgi:hypothetical protein
MLSATLQRQPELSVSGELPPPFLAEFGDPAVRVSCGPNTFADWVMVKRAVGQIRGRSFGKAVISQHPAAKRDCPIAEFSQPRAACGSCNGYLLCRRFLRHKLNGIPVIPIQCFHLFPPLPFLLLCWLPQDRSCLRPGRFTLGERFRFSCLPEQAPPNLLLSSRPSQSSRSTSCPLLHSIYQRFSWPPSSSVERFQRFCGKEYLPCLQPGAFE